MCYICSFIWLETDHLLLKLKFNSILFFITKRNVGGTEVNSAVDVCTTVQKFEVDKILNVFERSVLC